MSIKTTKKDINNNFCNVIRVSYGALQILLKYRDIMAHTEGYDGWGADIYDMRDLRNSTCIVTGYHPFGNVKPPYDLWKKYETKAEEHLGIFDDNRELFNQFIQEFIREALEERSNK